MSDPAREQWSSQRAFLLAAIGSAVGLGNIWRFPYITGINGGGAFVLVYCACIAVIGVPLLMAEMAIGRRGGRSPVGTMRNLSKEHGGSRFWECIGWQAVLAPTVGLMYYAVVAGWTMDYAFSALSGAFEGITDADGAGALFGALTSDIPRMMVGHAIFIGVTIMIVAAGIQKGLEPAVKFLMPSLAVILLVLVVYSALTADFVGGLAFLFKPDFYKLTPTVVLMAIGQAFFSVGVAVGSFITYSAYMPKNISIPRMAATVAAADTAVALLVGLVIFPLVLTYGLEPGEGPGLVFVTLPIAFAQMPAGAIFGALFFVLMAIAAVTSAISMLEPPVSWLVEHYGIRRRPAAIGAGAFMWLLGLPVLLSFNVLADFRPIAEKNMFELMDFFTANLVIPAGGFLIAVYGGWIFSKDSLREELGLPEGFWFDALRFVMRFVAPVAIALVFLTAL
ncbi:MAG: sodium-dependent transporter [Acidobacteria bacterium]|nr:MAG: sodium-dependent transporter [Acidobacteriota bacterium]